MRSFLTNFMHAKVALLLMLTGLLGGCVQKTFTKTVVYTLNAPGGTEVSSAGVRGNDRPLSWEADLELKPTADSTTYTATATYVTGYAFTEVKFTLNGKFELQDQPNRRVVFAKGDTTYYKAQFNKL